MIRIVSVTIEGTSDAGAFHGEFRLDAGLQVLTARNAFGKSLAANAFAWCLGLEPMFGVPDNDPAFFPLAVREELVLAGQTNARVVTSSCTTLLENTDGRRLRLSREIKGDPTIVRVEEIAADGEVAESCLQARRKTMSDGSGGLQRFIFEWLGWPRVQVATFRGTPADVYLENLAPLFYVEQNEGWTDLQARQIGKYQQQQIGQVAIEYLLGATDAIAARFEQQSAIQRDSALRGSAKAIAGHVAELFAGHGWAVEWSGNGAVERILERWSLRSISDALRDEASVDISADVVRLTESAMKLRQQLTKLPVDQLDISSHAGASQNVVAFKARRHELNEELHALRVQDEESDVLVGSLEQRLRAAQDVLRLKETGVGRLEHVECPICHRDLDPATFALTEQPLQSVRAHIEALKRDRDLVRKNADAIGARMMSIRAELARVETGFRDAERALTTVTEAVGPVRERLGAIASELSATEREIERLRETRSGIDRLQEQIGEWVEEARGLGRDIAPTHDLPRRVKIFEEAIRKFLIALGHSAVTVHNATEVHLDDQYVPFLANRRLKSLGSASDRSRLVAAYSLALAAAAEKVGGHHPGIVILDEPLQQNPDEQHREFFSTFMGSLTADESFQTIIFTFLRSDEIEALKAHGTKVTQPEGLNFLERAQPQLEAESREPTENGGDDSVAVNSPEAEESDEQD